jgi:hypothetical protein
MMTRLIKPFLALVLPLIAGCAAYSPSKSIIGQDRATLVASMGQPEREYVVDDLSVLHYPRGPAGSHTYFIYLDRKDLVIKSEQVLTEDRFDNIQSGMTKDQVIRILGISRITNGLARNRGYVWHYRYETPQCKSFVIEFTREDVVRSAGYRIRSGRNCKFVGMG